MNNPIENLSEQLMMWYQPLILIGTLIGFWLIIHSLIQLAPSGRKSMMGQGDGDMGKVLSLLFAGIFLVNIHAFMDSIAQTIYASDDVKGLTQLSGGGTSDPGFIYRQTAVYVVQLVGVIGIIRGGILLSRSGADGRVFPQAITHLIGGIMATNYVTTVTILASSFSGDLKALLLSLVNA